MTDFAITNELFFSGSDLDRTRAEGIVEDALGAADDGELFLEYRQSESLILDDGKVKSAAFDTAQGFGLRVVSGEATGYAHASDLSEAALKRASETVKAVTRGHECILAGAPTGTNANLYIEDNPLGGIAFDDKLGLLAEMDAYARCKDERIKQVTATLAGE